METTPFLAGDHIAAMIAPRQLSTGERALVDLLVQAVADWIRHPSRLPGLTATDPLATQAKLITYEVVVEALGPAGAGGDRRVRSYTTESDNRSTSVTYADASAIAAGLLDDDQRYLKMLGLPLTAAPAATFDNFDEAFVDRDPVYGRRVW